MGAYVLGSLASYHEFIARLSATALVRSLQISYRLAPEHGLFILSAQFSGFDTLTLRM